MAKYKLLDEKNHSIIYTDSEKRKKQLLEKGFHIYGENKPITKKRKVAQTNDRKTEN